MWPSVAESARGLAQSKSWRLNPACGRTQSVMECGSPLPLSAATSEELGSVPVPGVVRRASRRTLTRAGGADRRMRLNGRGFRRTRRPPAHARRVCSPVPAEPARFMGVEKRSVPGVDYSLWAGGVAGMTQPLRMGDPRIHGLSKAPEDWRSPKASAGAGRLTAASYLRAPSRNTPAARFTFSPRRRPNPGE